MGLSMKRFLVVITIYVLFSVKTATAFVPLAIPAWYAASALALAVAGGVGIHYAMTSTGITSIDGITGALSRAASAAYIFAQAGANVLKEDPLHAVMPFSKASELADKKTLDGNLVYPQANAAFKGVPQAPDLNKDSPVGSVAFIPGIGNKLITYADSIFDLDGSFTGGGTSYCGPDCVVLVWQSTTNGFYQADRKFYYSNDNRPPSPLGPADVSRKLASNNVSGPVKSSYQAELDRMFQDPDYVPTFTDDTTGLPYATPPGVLTPGQVTAINTAGAASDARASTITKIGEAAAAAAAAASPNDAALAAALAAANVALANAQAALADAQAKQAAAEAEQAKSQETLPTEDTTGKLHKWKWDKFETLKNLIPTVFPFSLISTLGSYLSVLVADPVAPSFDLPLYQSNVMHISLDIFDPVATVCRWLIGILLTIGGVQLVIGFWRGN